MLATPDAMQKRLLLLHWVPMTQPPQHEQRSWKRSCNQQVPLLQRTGGRSNWRAPERGASLWGHLSSKQDQVPWALRHSTSLTPSSSLGWGTYREGSSSAQLLLLQA